MANDVFEQFFESLLSINKLPNEVIEEGKSYPVKLSEEYEICDLNSFFEKIGGIEDDFRRNKRNSR